MFSSLENRTMTAKDHDQLFYLPSMPGFISRHEEEDLGHHRVGFLSNNLSTISKMNGSYDPKIKTNLKERK